MTQLDDLFDPAALRTEVDGGFVKRNAHPTLPISIYTYTRGCQYAGRWNRVTTLCRGLVVDDSTHEIVGRPFTKFFNVGEHEGGKEYAPPLPNEPFEVYEKVDGSLGILFHYDGKWIVASKGSFVSGQAYWGSVRALGVDLSGLNPTLTYCAEMLYPSNRIVVNYGKREDMVLLAAFHTDGTEESVLEINWPLGSTVAMYEAPTLADLMAQTRETVSGADAEGFVIRFASGVRAKAKFLDYVRLHKLMTGLTERDIWRALAFDALRGMPSRSLVQSLKCSPEEIAQMEVAQGGAFASIVDNVPEEFDQWVRAVRQRLDRRVDSVLADAGRVYEFVVGAVGTEDRSTFARSLQAATTSRTIVNCCFALLDNKDPEPLVWKSTYPAPAPPFAEDDEG